MILLIGTTLIIGIGYLISTLLAEKISILERFGTSFLLGFGVFTLLMFCYSTLGIGITLQSTFTAISICITILYILCKSLKRNFIFEKIDIINTFLKMQKVEKIITLLLLGLVVLGLVISIYYPVYIWDALALYDFRARIIAQQGFYTQIAKNFFWFAGYPLFTSLSHTIVYIFKGTNPQFLYSLMYISFILIFYSHLRGFVNRKSALIALLIMASTPSLFDHSTFAYTNLPYTIFLGLGSLYIFTWFIERKSIGYLILAAIFTGLSTWTRSTEPFWVVNLIFAFAFTVYRFRFHILPFFAYIFTFFLIRTPWSYVNYYSLNANVTQKSSLLSSEVSTYSSALFHTAIDYTRVSEVLMFIYKNVIVSWYPLLFIFIVCIIFNIRNFFKKASSLFLMIIVLYFIFLVYATYVYSLSVPYWYTIPDSARRMSMFFMPLMAFYIGLTLDDAKK